jgi:lipoate-protein ligase A
LHGHDVTVAIAMALPDGQARRLRDVYRAMVRPLAAALSDSGVPAALAEDAGGGEALRLADCFAAVSRNDVVDPGRGVKVCGCAMRVFPGWALLQASVPAAAPLVAPSEVFPGAAPARWSQLDPAQLAEALGRAIRQGSETKPARSL